jgi:hypothetical protein
MARNDVRTGAMRIRDSHAAASANASAPKVRPCGAQSTTGDVDKTDRQDRLAYRSGRQCGDQDDAPAAALLGAQHQVRIDEAGAPKRNGV